MIHKKYRPDIDGLRAIAVLAVLFYHVRTGAVHGGFVGVDVFFVISGYLITGIIHNDVVAGRFSIRRFYDRRIRRIFPALFAVLFATTVAGAAFLLPSEFATYANSLAATTLFASNIYFAAHAGYFAPGALNTPLLHTWSLAVEEQFYLLFPIALALAYKYFPKRLRLTVALCCILSFVVSAYGVAIDPQRTFFSSLARAWELLLGSLLALNAFPQVRSAAVKEAAATLGIVAIVACAIFYSDATPFPGISALIPTAGTALIIWSGVNTVTRVTALLSLRPVVFVGLISYSLYLWHWPMIVFTRLAIDHGLSKADKLFVICASLALANTRKFRGASLHRPPPLRWRPPCSSHSALTKPRDFASGFPPTRTESRHMRHSTPRARTARDAVFSHQGRAPSSTTPRA